MADKMQLLVNTIAPDFPDLAAYLAQVVKPGTSPTIDEMPLEVIPMYPEGKIFVKSKHAIVMPQKPRTPWNGVLWDRRLRKSIVGKWPSAKYLGCTPLNFLPEENQFLLCHPGNYFTGSQADKNRKKAFLKWTSKNYHWLVFSEYEKQLLTGSGNVDSARVSVIPPVYEIEHCKVSEEKIEKVKETYAAGHEYFIYYGMLGDGQNIIPLLKAYSAFKKWSRSSFKMLLCGHPDTGFEQLKSSLGNYRFQKDVVLIPHMDFEKQKALLSAAYAAIFPQPGAVSGKGLLQTLACHTPVIAAHDGVYPELAGDAALYFSAGSTVELKEQMLRLFKEEQLRKILQQNMGETPQLFTSEKSMAALLELLNASRESIP